MPDCTVQKCCFCIKLRKGSFIIGYLEVVIISLTVAGLITLILEENNKSLKSKRKQNKHLILLVLLIVHIVMCVASLVCAILLLLGLHKRDSGKVKGYLHFTLVLMIGYVLILFVQIILTSFDLEPFLSTLFGILIKSYFLLVVGSYYKTMEDGGTDEGV